MNQRVLQHLDRALQLLSTNRKIVKSFGNDPDDIIDVEKEPDIIEISDDEEPDKLVKKPVKLVKKRKERERDERDVILLPGEQVIQPLPKRKRRKHPDEQVIRPLPKQAVRSEYTDWEDEEITSPSLPLDMALEMAMKAKEELNKRLVHTAAIGDYKELLEEDQELQWNASISRTDTQNQFKLTLTKGTSKKQYNFFLKFKLNDSKSTATTIHFEIMPHNKRSKDLTDANALTVTKRLESSQLGSAEYFQLNIQNKFVLFEKYFELELGGKRIAIQSMK